MDRSVRSRTDARPGAARGACTMEAAGKREPPPHPTTPLDPQRLVKILHGDVGDPYTLAAEIREALNYTDVA